MAKKTKTHKDDFIAAHGQEMWELANSYNNHGDRSPEATEAVKLYNRFKHGSITEEYTVYGIYDGIHLLYIGKTSQDARIRWSEHKSRANKSPKAPIHHHMNEVGVEHFQFKVFEVFETELEAEMREVYLQDVLKPPFNKKRGGGAKSKLKAK